MHLTTAIHYADHIKSWLTPYCERIAIAGSVRRRRPHCNDIDIVVIPYAIEDRDMFGTVTSRKSAVWDFLDRYIMDSGGRASWIAGRENPDGRNYLVQLPKCQLDIFQATPDTWGTILLCRTGSKEHNIWLADKVKRAGGHWNPYHYLRLGGHPVDVRTEESIYQAIGVEFIPPAQREPPLP
jgi:DNA polymerase/3'-5' exonuclease PolX